MAYKEYKLTVIQFRWRVIMQGPVCDGFILICFMGSIIQLNKLMLDRPKLPMKAAN